MADPDLEQRRGSSFDLRGWLSSLLSFLHFLLKISGGGGGGGGGPGSQAASLDLPLVSADQYYVTISLARVESSSQSHVFFFKVDH